MGKKIITLNGISKVYSGISGQVKALNNISFSVERGEFTVITGESGSGKSTLMNIIGCLDKPSEGMYYLGRENVSRLGSTALARLRNRKIGFIFQDSNLISTLTACENVALPLYYRGIGRSERNAAASAALAKVGLTDRACHLPRELSGGQRQRVAIARAIAAEPDIILADEPTGALDSRTGSEIIGILRQISDNGGTVIIITHDDSLALSARRVLTISNGQLTSERIDSSGT